MSSLRILHLTDTHLFGDETLHYGVVDTQAHLAAALAHVAQERFDIVVCSGDVSEDGTIASYQRALTMIGSWAQERGALPIFAMGNHDNRSTFREVLGGGQPGARERLLPGIDPLRPIASVTERNGWRLIVLDSSVPGRGYGAIETAQFDFLRAELATPAPHGTVVIVHHPPVSAQTDLLQALALDSDDAATLIATIRDSDVRAVLSGHYHLPIVETVAGVCVVVAPGVANSAEPFGDRAEESAHRGFGGAVIEIDAARVRVVTFVERPEPAEMVFHADRQTVARIIDAAGRPN